MRAGYQNATSQLSLVSYPHKRGEMSKSDLQDGINRIFRASLSPLSMGLSALYALFAVVFALREPQHLAIPLSLAALCTSLICLGIQIVMGRKSTPLSWSGPVATFMLCLVAINCLLLVYLFAAPHQSAELLLLIVCGGIVLISRIGLTVFLFFSFSGWCLVVWLIGSYNETWTDFGFALVYATALSVLVHIVRRRSMEKLERYRIQNEQKAAELQMALISEEEAREFAENSKYKIEEAMRGIRHSRERFKRLSEATFEGLVIHDGGKILDTNSAFIKLSGYGEDEMIGISLLALIAPDSRESIIKHLHAPSAIPFEAGFLKKDGSIFPVEIYSPTLPSKDRAVQVTAIRDITLRKQAEEAIRYSEALYRQMFEKNLAMKMLIDPKDGRIVEANSAACEFYGYSLEQFKTMRVMDINTMPDYQIHKAMARAKSEKKRYFTFKHRLASGEIRNVEVYTGPIQVRGRELLYSIIHDITDRKNMERMLRQIVEATSSATGKDFFRSLVRSLAETLDVKHAFISELADPQGIQLRTIAHWNREVFLSADEYRIKDSPSENILQKKIAFYPESVQKKFPKDTWLKENRIEAYFAISLFDSNGKVLGALGIMHDQPMRSPSPAESVLKIFAARAVNEIERTNAEKALRKSEEKYRRFFEEDLTGDFISTRDGRLLSCNPAFAKIFGFTSVEEALKVDVNRLYHSNAARKKIIKRLEKDKKLESVEVEFVHTSGRPIYAIENVIGKFDDDGNLTEMRGYIFDITERKALEEQLMQSQKMEAVGRLAGGVAHDFNNLLTAITGYSELILSNLAEEKIIRDEVEEIKKACEMAASLTGQLLTFSRRQVLQPRLLDLNKVIADLNKLLKHLVGENIELELKMSTNLGHIRADLGQIKQVVMNLAVNAVDAMPRGGKLTIETRKRKFKFADQHENEQIKPGDYISLSVRDTGHGMDEETLVHIFEPFFTTKEYGKGTGLGMAMTYGVVKQSGGFIDVKSMSGEGTIIAAYFPRVNEREAIQELDQADFKIRRGNETILLVEDDDAVRRVTRHILLNNGYDVLEARNANEALAKYSQHNSTIDLLISDMVMPGMNGQELAGRLKDILPNIRVLFISGYVDNDLLNKSQMDFDNPFLQKPYSPDTLLMKVQEVLGN